MTENNRIRNLSISESGDETAAEAEFRALLSFSPLNESALEGLAAIANE